MSELSNDEIRLKIAQLKGWKVYVSNKNNLPIRAVWSKNDYSDNEFWIETTYRHAMPPVEGGAPFPNWSTDPAAAVGLVEEMAVYVEIRHVGDRWDCGFELYTYYRAETFCRAICDAYVAWKEAQS